MADRKVKLIGSAEQWLFVQKTLDDALASIYCHEVWQMLEEPRTRVIVLNPVQRPSFTILMKILCFFQSYRAIEQTLYHYSPLPASRDTFANEMEDLIIDPSKLDENPNRDT